MKNILIAGNVPYLAVVALCAAFFYLGLHVAATAKPVPVAVAERGAVVLEAVLEMPGASREELQNAVELPTKAVLQKYRDLGYLVIDTSRNDDGSMMVATLPETVIDITAEMRAAVQRAAQAAARPADPVDGSKP